MKQVYAICMLLLLYSCFEKNRNNSKKTETSSPPAKNVLEKNAEPVNLENTSDSSTAIMEKIGTLNKAGYKEDLKALYDKGVFPAIHSKSIARLPEHIQTFFKNTPGYELLAYSKGNLFQNDTADYSFVVYDKKESKISILIYDALSDKYLELYKDVAVINELHARNCNSASDDLGWELGQEIIDQRDNFLKDSYYYLDSAAIKIADISKDKDFTIKDGCLAKSATKADLKNALCISTSSVYNNWACLRYDKSKKLFLIFYSQAYAD